MIDDDGLMHSENIAIGRIISSYFQNIYTSDAQWKKIDWESALSGFPVKVCSEFYEAMSLDYSEAEVQTAVFQLNFSKAPGKDSFSALFFQKFWNEIKNQITKKILHFLNGGNLNIEQNVTQIILIPMTKNPTKNN